MKCAGEPWTQLAEVNSDDVWFALDAFALSANESVNNAARVSLII